MARPEALSAAEDAAAWWAGKSAENWDAAYLAQHAAAVALAQALHHAGECL